MSRQDGALGAEFDINDGTITFDYAESTLHGSVIGGWWSQIRRAGVQTTCLTRFRAKDASAVLQNFSADIAHEEGEHS